LREQQAVNLVKRLSDRSLSSAGIVIVTMMAGSVQIVGNT